MRTLPPLPRKPVSAVLAAMLFAAPSALAQNAPSSAQCEVASPMSPTRLLRRLSLDLRGRAPTLEELEAARAQGGLPPEMTQAWLGSEAFVGVMREHHEELLWPNLDQVELVPQNFILYPYPREDGTATYVSPVRSLFIRASGPGNVFQPCLNEPQRYDEDGRMILQPQLVGTATVAWLDGYVEVQPYWAPQTTIKVCAFEALEGERAPVCPNEPERYPYIEPTCQGIDSTARTFQIPFRGADVDCGGPLAMFAPMCGCGSDLRRCQTVETLARTRQSFNEQALRMMDRVVRDGRDYSEVLTDLEIEVNGPVAHYIRHQSRLDFNLFADADPTSPQETVELPFESESWRTITRTGRHSGVLTTPAYLMRHAAWRQRAHRFYNAFECASFEPSGPLPSPFAECSQREDLTERCGCDDCHRTLEPMAAHWGRFAEYGFMNLTEARFPTRGFQLCTPPFGKSIEQLFLCSRLYELDPVGQETPYLGFLNSYVFRNAEEQQRIAEGPRALVRDSVESGRFAACAVERMWTRFMHRRPTSEELGDVLPVLTQDFRASGHDLRALVDAIVRQPAYGRAP